MKAPDYAEAMEIQIAQIDGMLKQAGALSVYASVDLSKTLDTIKEAKSSLGKSWIAAQVGIFDDVGPALLRAEFAISRLQRLTRHIGGLNPWKN